MKTEFNVKYNSTWDNNNKLLKIECGNISHPLHLNWQYEGIDYALESDKYNYISCLYVCNNFIIVCFSKNSIDHLHPNNLVLYNLKKEILQIIPKPKQISIRDKDLPIIGMHDVEMINNIKHIPVHIGIGFGEMGYTEVHYLNIETFEYHPTYYDIIETNGQYSKTPDRYEKFGRN